MKHVVKSVIEPGSKTTYLDPRIANLLSEHGPMGGEDRILSKKIKYIVSGWDAILRDEKAKWTAILADEEWTVIRACTGFHLFDMESGSMSIEVDLNDAILNLVADAPVSEITANDPEKWRQSTINKLKGASKAAQFALVWMVIRALRRDAGVK